MASPDFGEQPVETRAVQVAPELVGQRNDGNSVASLFPLQSRNGKEGRTFERRLELADDIGGGLDERSCGPDARPLRVGVGKAPIEIDLALGGGPFRDVAHRRAKAPEDGEDIEGLFSS